MKFLVDNASSRLPGFVSVHCRSIEMLNLRETNVHGRIEP